MSPDVGDLGPMRHAVAGRDAAGLRLGLKAHATLYVLVNALLIAGWMIMNLVSAPGQESYWPAWPHLVWGVLLAAHGFAVAGLFPGPSAADRDEGGR